MLQNECRAKWKTLKEAKIAAVKEVAPKREKKSKSKWMTNTFLGRMHFRQQYSSSRSEEYKQVDKEIMKKCREAKETWLSAQCEDIEGNKNIEPSIMYRKIKEIAGFKGCSSTGWIKSKDGEINMEKDKILERWPEYIKDLFANDRGHKSKIRKLMEGPEILTSVFLLFLFI